MTNITNEYLDGIAQDIKSGTKLEDTSVGENHLLDKNQNSEYAKKVVREVMEINRRFSIEYKALWLNDAEDIGYLEEWVDRLIEETISIDSIKKAVDQVYIMEEYATYPPSLRSFIAICRDMTKISYDLPQKEDAYMIATRANPDMPLDKSHVVVRETVRRIGEHSLRVDPKLRNEFYRVYNQVCKEYADNDGDVSFNENFKMMGDFNHGASDREPPVEKEKAMSYIDSILASK